MIVLALLAAGVPLWHMTHEAAAASALPDVAGPDANSTVHLAVTFAQRPVRFEIDYLGKAVWQSEVVSALTAQKDISINYPKEGADFEYKVTWPPGTPLTAARLSVSANAGEPVEKTLWGTGQVDDVLTFP